MSAAAICAVALILRIASAPATTQHAGAATAAPAVASGETEHIQAPLTALAASQRVVSARLVDLNGRTLASYQRPGPAERGPMEVIKTPVKVGDGRVGAL